MTKVEAKIKGLQGVIQLLAALRDDRTRTRQMHLGLIRIYEQEIESLVKDKSHEELWDKDADIPMKLLKLEQSIEHGRNAADLFKTHADGLEVAIEAFRHDLRCAEEERKVRSELGENDTPHFWKEFDSYMRGKNRAKYGENLSWEEFVKKAVEQTNRNEVRGRRLDINVQQERRSKNGHGSASAGDRNRGCQTLHRRPAPGEKSGGGAAESHEHGSGEGRRRGSEV